MSFSEIEQEIDDFQFAAEYGIDELEFFSEVPESFIKYLPENFFIDYALGFTDYKPILAKLGDKYLWSIILQQPDYKIQTSLWAETPFEAFREFNLTMELEESDIPIESQIVKIYLAAGYESKSTSSIKPKTAKKLDLVKEFFEGKQ